MALTMINMLDEKKYMINSSGLSRLYEPINTAIPLTRKKKDTRPIRSIFPHHKSAFIGFPFSPSISGHAP